MEQRSVHFILHSEMLCYNIVDILLKVYRYEKQSDFKHFKPVLLSPSSSSKQVIGQEDHRAV